MQKIITILFIVCCHTILAQKFPFQYFGQEEGFPNPQIASFYQDNEGVIWMSTFGAGIVSYDGKELKVYDDKNGLSGNIVRAIVQSEKGEYFIGCFDEGLHLLKGDSAYRVLPHEKIGEIFHLESTEEGIWIGSSKGLLLYHDETLTNFAEEGVIPEGPITHISKDKEGNLWFNYDAQIGVVRYSNGEFQLFNQDNGIPEIRILATYTDSKKRVWVTAENGLYKKEENELKFQKIETEYLPNYYLFNIQELKDGNLLISSHNSGIVLYNPEKNKVKKIISENHGLKSATAFRIFLDREGNLWVSNWGRYVAKLNFSGLQYYSVKDLLNEEKIQSINTYNGGVLMGTSKGFLFYQNGQFEKIFPQVKTPVSCFEWLGDTLFYTDEKHIYYHYKGTVNQLKNKDGFGVKDIQYVPFQNTLYFVSWENGIKKWHNDSLNSVNTSFENDVDYIYCIFPYEKEDEVWFGTWNAGAVLLKEGQWSYLSKKDGLNSDKITSICKSQEGDLWLGTLGSGISYVHDDQVEVINNVNGKPISSVFKVIEDSKKRIWASTSSGLLRIIKNKSGEINTTLFDEASGWSGVPYHNAMVEYNGKIYVLTSEKIWIYDDQLSYPVTYNLTVYPEMFQVNKENRKINWDKSIKLNYDENHIKIRFSSHQINKRDQLKYFYRIVEKDKEFSSLGKNNQVDFPDLSPGTYTVEIKSCIGEQCSENNLTISFEIKPPWWQTIWFQSGVVIFSILLFILIYKWRTYRLIQRQKELENTVELRTKEVVKEKNEAEYQRELVEEKNREILDSINYAKRLQDAILPPLKLVKSYLEESFIIYIPKDIVAGDFYFMDIVEDNGKKIIYYAAADCTGHGVPGAMVSVVAANGLKRCIREFELRKPGEILDKLSELVAENFSQSEEKIRDGLDISLVALNKLSEGSKPSDGFLVSYAGANNPLWIVNPHRASWPDGFIPFKDGRGAEIKATKQAIGYTENAQPFETHTIELNEGDTIFTFSDGFPDQFGGEKLNENKVGGKKFKSANFKKLLCSIYDLPMEEQRKVILDTFENWKGDLEQVDDICIIGVRL